MKKLCLLIIFWLLGIFLQVQQAAAQAPVLPVKATLSQSLLSGKTFTGSSGVDTVVKGFSNAGAYTLELVAKVNGVSGRGLDIEGRNAKLDGFHLSLDTATLKSTSSLAAASTFTASRAAQNHTIRIAVNGDTAHIYQNGAYLLSQPLSLIKELVNGVETDAVTNAGYGANLIPFWAGFPGNNSGAPNAYGWAYTGTTVTNLFNTANSGSGVRYIDVTAAANPHTYNGNAYTGRVLYIRWDNSSYQNAVFSYPVTLEANTTYDFSWLYSLTANNPDGSGHSRVFIANDSDIVVNVMPAGQASQFQKQLNDMKGILQVLDTASFVERYAEYDWVENKRALVLAATLTPAGRYYAANKSDLAYNPAKAFVHTWKLVASRPTAAIADSDYFKVTVSFTDLNGETGSRYILERKIEGRDTGFLAVQTYTGYPAGAELNFADSVYGKATYRLKAFGLDGTAFVYSGTLNVVQDAAPVAPSGLTGAVISSSKTHVGWNTAAAARSYNLKRSLNAAGPWTTIQARTTTLNYRDTSLTPATTYYYAVTALNSAGESANSALLSLTTPVLAAPATVVNPHIASGDARTTLTWDFQYDAAYKILRSATAAGPYDTIATNVSSLRYVDYGSANNTTNYYKVIAYNPVGSSTATAAMAATPKPGQRLYMGFNNTTAAFAEDKWGGYHAGIAATATRDTGYVSRSLKMDGTAASYAALGGGLVDSLNSFTISAWIKMTALSNWMRIFDFGTGTSNYMFLTPQSSAAGGVSTIRYAIKDGGAEQTLSYGYTWPLNTWTHLAVTQSNDTVRLFINGSLVAATVGITIKPAGLGVTNLNYIGKSQFGADPELRGSVDEFAIFNNALGAREIADLFSGKIVLPIRLLSLEGRVTPQGNQLSWKVADPAEAIRMELERSEDARNFVTIYSVAGPPTGNASPFSYTDGRTSGAVSYYRLKMTDADGKIYYSPVITIANTAKGLTVEGIYPSVTSSSALLKIVSPNQTSIRMVIKDGYGHTVRSTSSSLAAGTHLLKVEAARLAAGAYTMTVYDAVGRVGSVRFIVSR